jgi:hypothetical protein
MPKTLKECMHRNDWPKWKNVINVELDSLEKRNIFGPCNSNP